MIFNTYTGNAMLNNAIMTIEALGGIKNVSDITPNLLLDLYQMLHLKELNKRMKSYTMLFTKNGPLHNDAKNGLITYDTLFHKLVSNVELEGNKTCEVSGLKFNTSFEEIFIAALKDIGLNDKEIQKKDTSLNRNWFPLIGGLGSDAQALPQAKFTVQVHPICVAIMQFLPLSALLYKGRILLIDSSNFDFARQYVASHVKEIEKRIQATSVKDQIENVKDFSKGNYLLKAIDLLQSKEIDDEYSDLNLWSFSNSGTGASCEIDRVPNSLLKKLMRMKGKASISPELVRILSVPETSYKFLESLENNTEWFGLYPNVFGSGKNRKEHEGFSIDFLEAYFQEIDSPQKTEYAKYLAALINKYKTSSFEKYLTKTDAWKDNNYKADLFAVLVEATKNGEWDLYHQLNILDNTELLPVKNFSYNIYKVTHFYYQKKKYSEKIPEKGNQKSRVAQVCEWIISIIQQDVNRERIGRNLVDQNYASVSYYELMIRNAKRESIRTETICSVFHDEDFNPSWFSINELLRIFFNQKNQGNYELKELHVTTEWTQDLAFQNWLEKINEFIADYQSYYFDKYSNKRTGKKPYEKFLNQISSIPRENNDFARWLNEAVENVSAYLQSSETPTNDKWVSDTLLFNPLGEISISFARFSIKFLFHKHYYFSTINQSSEALTFH